MTQNTPVSFDRDPYTGVSSIAHFDEFTKQSSFEKMVESFLEKIRERQEGDWEYWEEVIEKYEYCILIKKMNVHDSHKMSFSVAKFSLFGIRELKAIGSIGSLMMRTMRRNQRIQ